VVEVTTDDLAMDELEARQLLDTAQLVLGAAAFRELMQRTEGGRSGCTWPHWPPRATPRGDRGPRRARERPHRGGLPPRRGDVGAAARRPGSSCAARCWTASADRSAAR
jgi:hypothetical protein